VLTELGENDRSATGYLPKAELWITTLRDGRLELAVLLPGNDAVSRVAKP
jgi:hypothetical protein